MTKPFSKPLGRRELFTRTAPACALGCLGFGALPEGLLATAAEAGQEVHKFDVLRDAKLSSRAVTQLEFTKLFDFIRTLKDTIGEEELVRLLNVHSTGIGQRQGEQQAATAPDTEFQTFVATFRPPKYANSLTHEVVEDTETVFELRVTECIWASVFKDAGLDGAIGHATVCNMDYTWPKAFNPKFRMERDKTLMQGHDHCNHRYIQAVEG